MTDVGNADRDVLVKHLSIVEALYFGETFGRPVPEHLRWWDTGEENATMWAISEDESYQG